MTFRFCIVHCLPSAIRLKESVVPGALWFRADTRSKQALTDPNATFSAIDTTQTGIHLVLSLTPVMNDLRRVTRREVARPERFELPTLWFEARCSIQLSYGRVAIHFTAFTILFTSSRPFPVFNSLSRRIASA